MIVERGPGWWDVVAKRAMIMLTRRKRARMVYLVWAEDRGSGLKNLIIEGAVRTCRIGRMG